MGSFQYSSREKRRLAGNGVIFVSDLHRELPRQGQVAPGDIVPQGTLHTGPDFFYGKMRVESDSGIPDSALDCQTSNPGNQLLSLLADTFIYNIT